MFNIRNLINDSIQISKYTKIPILFLSNPGVSKTTTILEYARANDYEVEELIGAQCMPEEILGYQVNDESKESLTVKLPEWFMNIINNSKLGKKYIVFIDEITATSSYVQAALLRFIFSRKIQNIELPEDTVILAAGNYKNNLGGFYDMLSPTLNRFIVVNLMDNDRESFNNYIINNFCNLEMPKYNLAKYRINELPDDKKSEFEFDIKNTFREILESYKDIDSARGLIDLNNTDISGAYSREGSVYGIMSPRSMSYLTRTIYACIVSGIRDASPYVSGLIGSGSNQFTDSQLQAYNTHISKLFNNLISKYLQFVQLDPELTNLQNLINSPDFNVGKSTAIISEIINCSNNLNINVSNISELLINKLKHIICDDTTYLYNLQNNIEVEAIAFNDMFDSLNLLTQVHTSENLTSFIKNLTTARDWIRMKLN